MSTVLRVYHCDETPFELPAGHRFPVAKYALLRRRLVDEGWVRQDNLLPAPPASWDQIRAAHTLGWTRAVASGRLERAQITRLGFPWSPALVARALASVGGTVAAGERALEVGIGAVLAGGTHHAHAGFGAGFCVFNDLAVCALDALGRELVRRVLVLDLDVHQGDGTAAIFANDARVYTVSIHGAKNFPARKQASDLDLALPDGTADAAYLEALDHALSAGFERGRPDLILYQAGVDPLAQDRLGRLALSHEGLYERDRRVFLAAYTRGVPLALTLGGGYGEPIEASIEANVGTYRALSECYGIHGASCSSHGE